MKIDGKKTVRVMLLSLVLAIVLTAASIAVLAMIAYGFHFSDGKINVGVVIINIIACLFGGFLAGRGMKEKKYLWGLIVGILYFAVLYLCSIIFANSGESSGFAGYITTILICLGSGMLGGMIG